MSINNFEWLLDSIDAKVVQLNDFLIFELDDNRITFKDISHHFTWSKYVTNQIIEKLCIDIEKVFTPNATVLPQINLGISLPAHRGIAVGLKYELENILPRNVFVHRGIYKTDDIVIQQINYSNYQNQLEVVIDGVPNKNEMIYIRRMVEKCYVDKFISDNPTNNLFEV